MVCVGEPFQLNPPALKYISSMFLLQTSILRIWHCYLSHRGWVEGMLCISEDFSGVIILQAWLLPHTSLEKILFAFPLFHPPTRNRTSQCDKAQKHKKEEKNKYANHQVHPHAIAIGMQHVCPSLKKMEGGFWKSWITSMNFMSSIYLMSDTSVWINHNFMFSKKIC